MKALITSTGRPMTTRIQRAGHPNTEYYGYTILRSFKEPIVCDMLARVMPDSFGRIQFRPVGRKLEDFHVATVRLEPVVGFLFFVIPSIVLNQVDAVVTAVEGRHDRADYVELFMRIYIEHKTLLTGSYPCRGTSVRDCCSYPAPRVDRPDRCRSACTCTKTNRHCTAARYGRARHR